MYEVRYTVKFKDGYVPSAERVVLSAQAVEIFRNHSDNIILREDISYDLDNKTKLARIVFNDEETWNAYLTELHTLSDDEVFDTCVEFLTREPGTVIDQL